MKVFRRLCYSSTIRPITRTLLHPGALRFSQNQAYHFNLPSFKCRLHTSTSTCTTTATQSSISTSGILPEENLDSIPSFMFGYEENKNADSFFRNSEAYQRMMFNPEKIIQDRFNLQKFHPAVENFIESAMNPENTKERITSKVNQKIMDDVLSNLKSLKDEDLLQVLYHLRSFEPCLSAKEPDYLIIWSALDKECVSRMSGWNFDYLFTVADLWYGLYLARLSNFNWNLIKKCFRKCDKLSKEQFIRFMFCLNLVRNIPESINTYDIEYYLGKIADQLTSTEVSIISLAFFKTQTTLRCPNSLESMLNVVIKDAKNMSSINVAAVAKFARFCSTYNTKNVIFRLQNEFLPEIDRLSIPACTHLALVGTKSHLPHKELINAVVKKIEKSVKEARLKELERISLAMTMFNVECDKLAHLIVEELRSPTRLEEIRLYGRCLPAILHYLSIKEIFPEDLISIALADSFRKTYYGNKWTAYQRELLCLDFSTELEIPNYSGNRLNKKVQDGLTKRNILRLSPTSKQKVSDYENSLKMILSSMESILGGSKFVFPCNVLPHHHSIEIVFCTDDKGNPIPIPEKFRQLNDYEVKKIPKDVKDVVYHTVFFCSRNNIFMDSEELSGQTKMQIRQLKKMGYLVHTVLPSQIPNSEMTTQYILTLISNKK